MKQFHKQITTVRIDEDLEKVLKSSDVPYTLLHTNGTKSKHLIRLLRESAPFLDIGIASASDSLTPDCAIGDSVVFVGWDMNVCILNFDGSIRSNHSTSTVFYQFAEYNMAVVAIFEAEVMVFDSQGNVLQKQYLDDIVSDFEISSSGVLLIKLFEGGIFKLKI